MPVSMMEGMVRMVADCDAVGRAILLILFILSIISWAVIIERWATFRQNQKNVDSFVKAFRSYSRLSHLLVYQSHSVGGAISRVFEEGCSEIPYLVQKEIQSTTISEEQLHRVRSALDRRIGVEIANLERNLFFLATTGTAGPSLGFFGTVWGIQKSFMMMGYARTTDILVIGPGIALALVTTVAGLLTAIPALAAYNYLINQVKGFDVELNNFASEFIDTLAKGSKA
ncbi:MAG: MotA/TolQ/ExbB proton channel family protein [Candidatus Eisenbacteria bacterium]|jgi:biopolymer transport protein ExbB/TolQ|nr:MotA/TolQ/ExbB proton channel family protein [Candidatus Eisenbacteria bacterium]